MRRRARVAMAAVLGTAMVGAVLVVPASGASAAVGTIAIIAPAAGWHIDPELKVTISYTLTNIQPLSFIKVRVGGAVVATMQVKNGGNGPGSASVLLTGVTLGAGQTLSLDATDTDGMSQTTSELVNFVTLPRIAALSGFEDCAGRTYPVTVSNRGSVDGTFQVSVDGSPMAATDVATGTQAIVDVPVTGSSVLVTVDDVTTPGETKRVFGQTLREYCETAAARAFDGTHPAVAAVTRSAPHRYLFDFDGHGRWLLPSVDIGSGWGPYSLLTTVGDFATNNAVGVVGRDPSGNLVLFDRAFAGSFVVTMIGSGWLGIDKIAGVGDFNADGHADLLASVAATGQLWLYPGDGTGHFLARHLVGNGGWTSIDAIVGVGDFDGDGHVDLIARVAKNGDLYLYPGSGSGTLQARRLVGSGWSGFDTFVGVGDFDGDGHRDLLARVKKTGDLYVYPGNGSGGWLPRKLVGTGWDGFSKLA